MVANQRLKVHSNMSRHEGKLLCNMVHLDSTRGMLWRKIQKKYNMYGISKSWFYDKDCGILLFFNKAFFNKTK